MDVKAGEYLLAVDGKDLTADRRGLRAVREQGRQARRAHGRPEGRRHRARGRSSVEPIADESALRNRDWVEGNLKKVHERTGGRVAYVYVPNTADLGHAYFKRYFFPQVDKDAIIVDERFNGGGSGGRLLHRHPPPARRELLGDAARRRRSGRRARRSSGPKVMLIDETAGSGGDLLPWMFRQFKLGPLVGQRTWGGLVGILGFPVLMDGGGVTAPDLAFYTEDGWRVENEGVPPDVEVEQWPADVAAGKDPQLDKAIEVVLEELKDNPPKPLPRPSSPSGSAVQAKRGAQ